MIYVVGTSQDVQAIMRDRPLLDLAKVKQISQADQINGVRIYPEDEVIYGYSVRSMRWNELISIKQAIEDAEMKGTYERNRA